MKIGDKEQKKVPILIHIHSQLLRMTDGNPMMDTKLDEQTHKTMMLMCLLLEILT